MTTFLAGLLFGALLAWFLRAGNTGATTRPVLPFGRPAEIDSVALVRALKEK